MVTFELLNTFAINLLPAKQSYYLVNKYMNPESVQSCFASTTSTPTKIADTPQRQLIALNQINRQLSLFRR